MSARVKIGSYIIDAAETASTSNTAGVRLLTDEKPGVRWNEDRTTGTFRFFVQIDAASTAALKTARDAFVNAVTKTVNADVVLESAAGTTFKDWLVSTGAWQKISAAVEVDENDENALVLVVITAERIAAASGSSGDPAGNLDGIDWALAIEANGKASATGTAVFNTRLNAAAWVQGMRDATLYPSWMHATRTRFLTASYSIPQQPNASGPPAPEASFTPVQATVAMLMLPNAWASDSAFDNIVDGEADISVRPRPRLQEEANALPGLDVMFSGRLQFKTEVADTFDSNDSTSTAAGAIKAAALAAIDVMKADLEARRDITFDYFDDVELIPSGKTGEVFFTVMGLAEFDGIFEFSDNVVIELTTRDKVLEGTKGSVVMQNRLGYQMRCMQSGVSRSDSLLPILKPSFIDSSWLEVKWTPSRPVVRKPHGQGPTVYEQAWSGEWLKLSNGTPLTGGTQFDELAGV